MDLIRIGLGGLLAALSWGIAWGLHPSLSETGRRSYCFWMIVVVGVIVIFNLSDKYFGPKLTEWDNARTIESLMLKEPVYQAIKQYDPEMYENISSEFRKGLKQGSDQQQIHGSVRDRITVFAQKRLPHASDEAVVSHIKIMLNEMDELNKHGGDLCFRFLFPQARRIDAGKYLSKQIQEADHAALAQIIKTSTESPQPIPEEAEVKSKMKPILLELSKIYGNDLWMLQNPTASNVNKDKVCEMTADLYKEILKLPPNESGKILRFMLSQE